MPLEIGMEMPPLTGATEWFNATGARAAAEAAGRLTLVHFWAISCAACETNLPRVGRWRDESAGLCVIAIHTPRDEADRDVEAVREAVSLRGITEPCAVDNEGKLRAAFQHGQDSVPAYYLFDREGKLRSYAAGEDSFDALASEIERVLARPESDASA